MIDPTRPDTPEPEAGTKASISDPRRWLGPVALATAVLVPIGILIFSNLDSAEVSWAGFEIRSPLWTILVATFLGGMVGGKLAGWGWRRWRKRRKRLKEELKILRKHVADPD